MNNFRARYFHRLNECNKDKARLDRNYGFWLDSKLLSDNLEEKMNLKEKQSNRPGRPLTSFDNLSERAKRRRTSSVRSKMTTFELLTAAASSLATDHKQKQVKVIQAVAVGSPGTMTRLGNALKAREPKPNIPQDRSIEKSLALFIDNKMTVEQYRNMREVVADINKKQVLPSYQELHEAKLKTYPEGIVVTDNSASISLQSLLDHTTKRLIESFTNVDLTRYSNVHLISKYGMDGTTGLKTYKYRNSQELQEEDLFHITLVPLRLVGISNGEQIIIWNNPRPSSTRLCRPYKFMFQKETSQLVIDENLKISEEIKTLQSSVIRLQNDRNLEVGHELIFSMVDGKITQILTNTSSAQICIVCGATPVQMNNMNIVFSRTLKIKSLEYGLSPLHAYIRFYECILHIAYRLDFKKWRVTGDNKKILQNKKQIIQKKFREELGIIVDIPTPGGSGNSNDGNSARTFFREYVKASKITNVNEGLIKRFGVILSVLNSGIDIDQSKFRKYCTETAMLYVEQYSWYYMPRTVHHILIHGPDVIENFNVPIGLLSEEPQESLNKIYKNARTCNTRKTHRQSSNEDLIHYLLMSSDPLINSFRKKPRHNKYTSNRELRDEAVEMLLCES